MKHTDEVIHKNKNSNKIFYYVKKKYGKQLAQILEQNDLLKHEILQMITYFNRGPVDLEVIQFMKQFLWHQSHESENQDRLIFQSLAHASSCEEKDINQRLLRAWQEKNYEAFVKGLFEKAGYDIIIADTLEKQNSIRKYFEKDEELCTFHDKSRYKRFYIIHAVKKNAHKIPRSPHPSRQDDYGTSVISIQISKKGFFISIKNRYNHTVQGCDNTFNSNPDNIIFGLSLGIKRLFNVEFEHIEVPKGFIFINNTYLIPYHKETDGYYFCQKGFVKGNQMTSVNPDFQCVIEDVVLDKRARRIFSPVDSGLAEALNQEIKDQSIQTKKLDDGRQIIFLNNQHFMTVKEGKLQALTLRQVKVLPKKTLYRLEELTSFEGLELEEMEEKNLYACTKLTFLNLPKVKKVGIWNFSDCQTDIFLPQLSEASICTFRYCTGNIHLPQLKKIGLNSFYSCAGNLNLPELKVAGQECFYGCKKRVYAPKLQEAQWNSFRECKGELILDGLEKAFDSCFIMCEGKMYLPELRKIGRLCFYGCTNLPSFPNLQDVGKNCFLKTHPQCKPLKISYQGEFPKNKKEKYNLDE